MESTENIPNFKSFFIIQKSVLMNNGIIFFNYLSYLFCVQKQQNENQHYTKKNKIKFIYLVEFGMFNGKYLFLSLLFDVAMRNDRVEIL